MRKCCATQQRRSKWRRQLRQVSYPSYVTPISPLYHPIILLNFQNQDNYEVESILDSKVVSGKTVYLVQWKGYDEDGSDAQPTWEPAANLEGAREIVRDYEAKRRAAAERPAREGGGEWGGNRAREGGAPTSSDMCKVLRIKKPPTGEDLKDSELFFEVLCADGSILERISEKVLTAELYTCKLLYSFMRQRLSFF